MTGRYTVITNNPLVLENLKGRVPVAYRDVSYVELLREVRDQIHKGGKLLTHPLSGSVKPGETPYKSVMLLSGKGDVDERSLDLIENAIQACSKFQRKGPYRPEVDKDFQLVDWTLLEGALASAGE